MSGSVPATTLAHSRCNSTLSPTSCSDTPQSVAIYTPASSPSPSPQPSPRRAAASSSMNEAKSEPARAHEAPPGATSTEVEAPKPAETAVDASIAGAASTTPAETPSPPDSADGKKNNDKKSKAKSKKKKKKKQPLKCKKTHKHKKVVPGKTETDADAEDADSDDSDDAESDVSSASSSDSSDSSSAEEKKKKKSKAKKKKEKEKAKAKKKAKKNKKSKKDETSSDSDSDSDSSSDSDSEDASRKKRRKRRARKAKEEVIDDEETTDDQQASAGDGATLDQSSLAQIAQALQSLMANQTAAATSTDPLNDTSGITDPISRLNTRVGGIRNPRLRRGLRINRGLGREVDTEVDKPEDGKAAYKRVDQIWDTNIHDYRLQETAKEQADAFEGYVFHVRRKFDWENKYRNTIVDIKSKYLREALQEVMKDVRAISLVENEPSIDPNMLFLYLEEMRTHYKKTLKERIKKEKKKKIKKRLQTMREHLKLMVGYLDKDYDQTKKTLGPMLKAGNITFDLIWALFRPNSIAYTTTYGANDHPRCFKVDQAYREKTFMRGEFYVVEGRYLEYDGKNFGLGEFEISIDHFKGPKKITQLATYPLEYHKEPDVVRTQLIERGKKFVSLAGMNFKFMKGMAFQKKKKQILKFNINGRVMVDPKTFRRENANYQVSTVRTPEERDDDDDSCDGCCSDEESDDNNDMGLSDDEGEVQGPTFRIIIDENNKTHLVEINGDEEEFVTPEKLDELGKKREFTEEELLISSSIVLGFSFNEKQWFEFSVSGIGEIVWDDKAFDSLVLDPNHKSIVKAQVCSHKFHSGETIDDVIQGKGKGLVFVLHGPPGVGKTLTAEGIAEFLRCPLYAVSAGDLGTDARIEHELNKIMAIAHSWGAVLLLDEADVFLEKRQHQDVHRNALVSVFLRLLEYFQGILFLTTNRVETFDEAFQSRIHIALKYSELGMKAKKEIWRMFLGKVKETGGELANFRESDYERLAKSNLNGRQIKNMVKTAQALAVFEKTPLNMEHVRRVLDVGESFERDLKGGTGFEDAMRSYT